MLPALEARNVASHNPTHETPCTFLLEFIFHKFLHFTRFDKLVCKFAVLIAQGTIHLVLRAVTVSSSFSRIFGKRHAAGLAPRLHVLIISSRDFRYLYDE
jgi:hypothetical protein